jgi:hypothetical protein
VADRRASIIGLEDGKAKPALCPAPAGSAIVGSEASRRFGREYRRVARRMVACGSRLRAPPHRPA